MAAINHVFVLMLENQSFDRLLGLSGITGFDPVLKKERPVDGSNTGMSNTRNGESYYVSAGAPWSMTSDPNHEFEDVFEQLTGKDISEFNHGQPYPTPTNTGFVQNFAKLKPGNLGDIMSGYTPEQLPVINALAKEFAVCDRWFSSMPGPTWPNRFFLHGGSSGGLDHSPSMAETAEWETGIPGGFAFQNESIFDKLKNAGQSFRFYRGNRFLTDDYPIVSALRGITPSQSHPIDQFADDLKNGYSTFYTFIEPSYGNILNSTYAGGTSQHPMDDVRGGEWLIKQTYEAIRNSPVWESSLLLITWDEHGGFFDHVIPPAAVVPGDLPQTAKGTFWDWLKSLFGKKSGEINKHGFTFNQYGVRVPALVVSPWVPRNTVDGTMYDHSTIPATLRALRNQLPSLTKRDQQANNVLALLSLEQPRKDAPLTLPGPDEIVASPASQAPVVEKDLDHGSVPGFAYLALRNNLDGVTVKQQRQGIRDGYEGLQTNDDLRKFFE
ncbi:MAG TPA: alkaline phosphatase family protein, partial [Cyclobacteriaceae bacterium]|nr:alkaline phosphatase family protein [Cyclobacteriaceae bacterium]